MSDMCLVLIFRQSFFAWVTGYPSLHLSFSFFMSLFYLSWLFSVYQIYPCPFVFILHYLSLFSLNAISVSVAYSLHFSVRISFFLFLPILVVRVARPALLAIWHRGRSHRRPNWRESPNRRHFASLDLKRHADISHRRPTS